MLEGGDELDVGDDRGREMSSSVFQVVFLFLLSTLVLVTMLLLLLLLLLTFLDFKAGDSCSLLVGGDGGEFAGQAMGIRPGWKKAGFPSPVAAINWLAINNCDGVNMAGFGNAGYPTFVKGLFKESSSLEDKISKNK